MKLAGVVAYELLGERLVAAERRAVARLTHLVWNLRSRGDQPMQALGGVVGHRHQRLVHHQVTHAHRVRGGSDRTLPCKRGCRTVARFRKTKGSSSASPASHDGGGDAG